MKRSRAAALTPGARLLPAMAALATATLIAGCGAGSRAASGTSAVTTAAQSTGIPPALLKGARPIGRGPRFTPPLAGEPTGDCAGDLGRRRQAHIEVFAQNRVVLIAAGIGTRSPRAFSDGHLTAAACFGEAVTLDPTGTVYFRVGADVTLRDLFAEWGHQLSRRRIATFTGGSVRVYVDGRARRGPPGSTALTDEAEIVLEIGPYVPPHSSFTFPRSPSPRLR